MRRRDHDVRGIKIHPRVQQVTAEDAAYTWATFIKYNTKDGAANKDYIDTIEAKDPQTVVIKAKLGADGKAVNPLIVNAFVTSIYINQKAWTQKLEQRVGGGMVVQDRDATAANEVTKGKDHPALKVTPPC